MKAEPSTGAARSAVCREFATTHWSVVPAASRAADPEASEALAQLCATYWYPLCASVRRRGCAPADTEDVIQEFFARLLTKGYLARADPQNGKFRAFSLGTIGSIRAVSWLA
jgi:RNA polymerase sigma-70 factor (ECF subfamily)